MKFSDFFSSICTRLEKNHAWGSVGSYLVQHPDLIEIIYQQYLIASKSEENLWPHVIMSTAQIIDDV